MTKAKVAYERTKTIRIPEAHEERLLAEALETGIDRPGVLLRFLLIDRLRKGDIAQTVKKYQDKLPGTHRASPMIKLSFTTNMMDEITILMEGYPIEFNTLIRIILAERYDKLKS